MYNYPQQHSLNPTDSVHIIAFFTLSTAFNCRGTFRRRHGPGDIRKILHICNKIDIHRPLYDAMQDRTAAALRRMQRTAGQSEQEMPGHASGTTSPNDTGCRGHPENASPPQGRKRQMPQLSATAFTPCYYPISVHPAKKRKGKAFEALPFPCRILSDCPAIIGHEH